ncbi:MAG: SPOR domain-containing protein [Syntrophobacteraceae bacterium]
MAKKYVVQRDLRKRTGGGAPYLKYLVFSAIGLIFLVVITPYLLRDKSREANEKKPLPQVGAVTNQLPQETQQQPMPVPANPPASATTATPPAAGGAVSGAPASAVSSVSPQAQPTPAPTPSEQGVNPSQEASSANTMGVSPPAAPQNNPAPAEAPQAQQKVLFPNAQNAAPSAQPAQEPQKAQKELFPKSENAAQPTGAQEVQAKAAKERAQRQEQKKAAYSANKAHKPVSAQAHKPAGKQCAKTPVCTVGGQTYAVQVGAVYRNLKQAMALQKRLAARGYRVALHRAGCSGYLVVTPAITQSKAYTLQAQMSAVGVRNTKVVGACTLAR